MFDLPLSSLQQMLFSLIIIGPVIYVGFRTFVKMKARYKRPLERSTDLRVYVITFFFCSLTFLIMYLLVMFMLLSFFAPIL